MNLELYIRPKYNIRLIIYVPRIIFDILPSWCKEGIELYQRKVKITKFNVVSVDV